ncbi:MAG TPA: NADH-quinone oxidoreductase subunit NuoH [bacterium]|nr:NADH-quinone oxidoreductase subunit NuoH [bacterium]HPR87022.1 NADH-quinone oxidoreductase subunit NuoH [bacterium]
MNELGFTWIDTGIILAKIVIVIVVNLLILMIMELAERRVSAFIQDRLGPNRVGPEGLFQAVADGIKFFFKEEIFPAGADKVLYTLAPLLVLVPALMTFAAIPFGHAAELFGRTIPLQIVDLNVGILFIFALVSLGVYGVVLGGWASNSKYPFLGGLRASAQMISYELSLGMSIIGIIMITGSLRLSSIVEYQSGMLFGFLPRWNIFLQPLAFVTFLVASFAEANRLPFDLAESEPELVGGYHTEYSSMKFAMFFMGEYVALITTSAVLATLFFGGWDFPWVDEAALGGWGVLLSLLAFALKTGFFLFLFLWVRWTIPRFRFDQLMRLGWKILIPLALVNILLTGAGLLLVH